MDIDPVIDEIMYHEHYVMFIRGEDEETIVPFLKGPRGRFCVF